MFVLIWSDLEDPLTSILKGTDRGYQGVDKGYQGVNKGYQGIERGYHRGK